jgi:hypothetical protein
MAISGGDGSIILTTKVDQSGLNKGMTSMQNGVKSLSSSFKALGSTIAAVFSITAIINFSKQAGEFATQTEASVQRLIDIYGEAAQSVGDFIDANARAIGMSKASASSFASVYGNLFSVWADQSTNAELTNRYLNMTAVVASKTGRTVQDVQERIRSGLLGNTEAIEDLGVFVNVKTIEMTDAFQRMADGKSWEQLDAYTQQQVRTMAILEQATSKYGNTVADTTATTRAQYQAAYEDFQNTWGQVVNKVLIPVLKVLTQVFTIATKGLQIIAGLTGKTTDTSTEFSNQEKSIGGVVDNQNALTDAVKDTNKELKKSLANFDEINILSQDTAESGGLNASGISGGVSGIGDIGGNYDSSFVDKISGDMAAIMGIVGGALVAVGLLLMFFGQPLWGIGFIIAGASVFSVAMATLSSSDQVTPISENLMKILAIAGTALVALGLILLFGGVWKWGIAFLVAGAAALGVAIVETKSGNVDKEAEEMLINIMTIAGAAMLALGVILLCFGVVSPLSIGLVVAGVASLAGAIALNPQLVFENVSKFLTDNAGLIVGISLALLVLGIVLCVCGIVTPLSIGMIVVGATGLVAEIVLNWNYIVEKVTSFFQENSALIVGVSSALLVLGIILCCTGVALPLGIGLIVAGATGLVAEATLNWEFLKEQISTFFQSVYEWVTTWGILVLGIILAVSGVALPLGLSLMKQGGANLTKSQDPLWTTIVDKIKEVWETIKTFWNQNIAKWFTAEHWGKLGKQMMDGLIEKIENGISKIKELISKVSFGSITSGIKEAVSAVSGALTNVDSLISSSKNKLNSLNSESFSGFSGNSYSISNYSIPKLAKGTVIPPNKEFLAVLGDQKKGTNIEAPLDTIVQAMNVALAENTSQKSETAEIVLEMNGREFGRAAIDLAKRESRIRGTRLVFV